MLSLLFLAIGLFVVILLAAAARWHRGFLLLLMVWAVGQGALAATGFFKNTGTVPPRMLLLVLPPLLGIGLLFAVPRFQSWLDTWDVRILTALHAVRLPIEIGLALLFAQGLVPRAMTYHGHNFDVVSGLTAPLVLWYLLRRKHPSPAILIAWNGACLILLGIVVVTAIGAVPSPFQGWSFDQPNVGVLRFPFTYLPGLAVPAVLLAHLVCLRQLLWQRTT